MNQRPLSFGGSEQNAEPKSHPNVNLQLRFHFTTDLSWVIWLPTNEVSSSKQCWSCEPLPTSAKKARPIQRFSTWVVREKVHLALLKCGKWSVFHWFPSPFAFTFHLTKSHFWDFLVVSLLNPYNQFHTFRGIWRSARTTTLTGFQWNCNLWLLSRTLMCLLTYIQWPTCTAPVFLTVRKTRTWKPEENAFSLPFGLILDISPFWMWTVREPKMTKFTHLTSTDRYRVRWCHWSSPSPISDSLDLRIMRSQLRNR